MIEKNGPKNKRIYEQMKKYKGKQGVIFHLSSLGEYIFGNNTLRIMGYSVWRIGTVILGGSIVCIKNP